MNQMDSLIHYVNAASSIALRNIQLTIAKKRDLISDNFASKQQLIFFSFLVSGQRLFID